MQYVDIAPYIDEYGTDKKYNIAFDIKSEIEATMQVYCQNGSTYRYSIGQNIVSVSREFQHKNLNVQTRTQYPDTDSMLAFYGTYDTGNIPYVKNLRFDLGEGYETGDNITYNQTENSQLNLYAKWIPTAVTLPTPTKEGYTFLGWYTEKEGGEMVDNTYTPNQNITLYAHWQSN